MGFFSSSRGSSSSKNGVCCEAARGSAPKGGKEARKSNEKGLVVGIGVGIS